MSDSVRPHRRQPMRFPRPWDSPGKNTGVGCHFLLQCMKVKSESEVTQSCPTLSDPMDCSLPGSSVHGIFQARTLQWVAISLLQLTKWFIYYLVDKIYEVVLYLELSLTSYWRRQWQPTPGLLPGKSLGQRRLVGCSPWSR